MASESAMTIIKMLETLPEQVQDRVVEHLREYIEELRDEALWNESYSRTQANLVAAAQRVRKEIAKGKATPLDMDKL
jgi:predicted HAD superfamily phosphohydrolase